ncbi:LCCL domain-containing protein [Yoonia sp. 208BN28-4]|uniref:LCCL domain-containing protein n=1 Tax=Yoonia sp. 208BN28-4 TaxID=3126505 RepID=UPI0030AFF8F2
MRGFVKVFAVGFGVSGGAVAAQDLPECGIMPDDARSLRCTCPAGVASGSVWGSGPYTADSAICAAGVHAGVIGTAGGPVIVIRRPGQDSYQGSEANGVTTSNWGSYEFSIDVRRTKDTPAVETASSENLCNGFPSGETYVTCDCPANPDEGSVWGSDPYTSDSDICTAALHVGYIEADGGTVRVIGIQGLDAYLGTTVNGITTQSWSSYSESFVFDWNHE